MCHLFHSPRLVRDWTAIEDAALDDLLISVTGLLRDDADRFDDDTDLDDDGTGSEDDVDSLFEDPLDFLSEEDADLEDATSPEEDAYLEDDTNPGDDFDVPALTGRRAKAFLHEHLCPAKLIAAGTAIGRAIARTDGPAAIAFVLRLFREGDPALASALLACGRPALWKPGSPGNECDCALVERVRQIRAQHRDRHVRQKLVNAARWRRGAHGSGQGMQAQRPLPAFTLGGTNEGTDGA